MRKLLKKSLACCLAIALCFTMVFGAVSASAAATALADIGEVTVTNDKDAVALPITITDTSAGGINIATLSIALPELNGVYLNEITNIEAEGVKVEWVTADGNGCAAGASDFVAPKISSNKFTLMLEADGDLSGFKNATINVSFAVKGADLGVYVVSATKFTAAGSTGEDDIYDIETTTEAGSITVEDPHVCEGKGDYLYDEGYHWQLCDCGKQDKLNYAEHDFNDGVVTVEADCDTTGEKTYTCKVCGKTKTETIPATGHDYDAVVTAPTCTAEGYTTYTCSVCDDSYVADKVAATGHTWDEGVINPAPTCTTEGVKTFTCSACNETRTEAVSELGHKPVAYEEVAATCTQTGYTGGTYCSVCGATIEERTVVDALGHTEAAAVKENEVEPTLNSSGSYDSVVYCSVCGAELSRTKVIVDALTGAVAEIGGFKYATLAEAIAAAKAGEEIDLLADITLEKGIILNGVTLDGNGYTLTVTGEGGVAADGETYAIFSAEGLTVKNIKIVGGARGIYVNPAYAGLKYDVVFENVTILASCRAFNVTDYSKKDPVKLIVTGGEFAGKISWSSRMNATFTGVKFSENASVKGNVIDLRGNVTFDTCIFADGYKLSAEDLKGGEIIKVENTIVDAPEGYVWYNNVLHAHTYDAVVTAPTCTEGGYTTYTCSVCGDTYVADETAALGHDYSAVVTAPTCTEGGYTTYTCSVCGDTYVADETAALDHNVVFTDNGNGTHDGTCDRVGCGIVVTDNEAHIDANADNVCDKCSATIAVPCEHNWEFISGYGATTTDEGKITLKCSECGEEQNRSVYYHKNSKIFTRSALCQSEILMEYQTVETAFPVGYEQGSVILTVSTTDSSTGKSNVVAYYSDDAVIIGDTIKWGAGVAAYQMTEDITLTVYSKANGEWYSGEQITFKFTDYALTILQSSSDAAIKKIVIDLVNYGSAVQTQNNYKTEELANATFTEYMSLGSDVNVIPDATDDYTKDVKNVRIVTCELFALSRTTLKVGLGMTDGDFSKVVFVGTYVDSNGVTRNIAFAKDDAALATVSGLEFDEVHYLVPHETNTKIMYAEFFATAAYEMRAQISFQAYLDGVEDTTMSTSIRGMAARMRTAFAAQPNSVNTFNALIRYGDSAEAKFASNN